MARKLEFELHDYAGSEPGEVADRATVTTVRVANEQAARGRAGRLAKRRGGPVDLARAGTSAWEKRYVTTAAASEYHTSGYRFERLDG